MKKLLLLVLIVLSIFLGYSFGNPFDKIREDHKVENAKTPLMKIALVADSENENELLAKALRQAQAQNANFVIGLGDWTQTGTIDELLAVKHVFDDSRLGYNLTAGDHDLWDSRDKGKEAHSNFYSVLGPDIGRFSRKGVNFVIVDNSDIYKGFPQADWQRLNSLGKDDFGNVLEDRLTFVFAHKTPFHPDSAHIMGEDTPQVASQAKEFLSLLEGQRVKETKENTPGVGSPRRFTLKGSDSQGVSKGKPVDGFFSGDLHFFAKYQSPSGSVKITTIGAVASERNSQGPRFGILTIYDDYSWEVEDVGI